MTTGIAVIVATFGSSEWEQQGIDTAREARKQCGPWDVAWAVHDEIGTLAHTRNLGADQTRPEWLCFLDADDMLGDGYLDAMRATVDNVAVGSMYRLCYPAIRYAGVTGLLEPRRSIWQGNWMPIGTLIHRDIFGRCGGFWEERGWEDWSLWIRACGLGCITIPVPGAVYQASVHEGRNHFIDRPYELGAEIRDTNVAFLSMLGRSDGGLAAELNAEEARHNR